MPSSSREAALVALVAVERDGAFLSSSLERVFGRFRLRRIDRALCTELTYGVLRHRTLLDFYLGKFSSRPLDSLSVELRNILRLGAYQLVMMDKIPASAAVNESVKLAHGHGHRGIAAFVNGVLRNLERRYRSITWPDPRKDPVEYLAVRFSHPRWMVARWLKLWGLDETAALCQANNQPLPLTVRVNTLRTSKAELSAYFESQNIAVQLGLYAPDVLRLSGGIVLGEDRAFIEGLYYVQDESSVLVGHAVAPQPGEVVYDLCSAPGGKSTHLAQLMKNQGRIVAVDKYDHKLKLVMENAERLGISIIKPVCADATDLGDFAPADRVLVDAPCLGLGVLRHRPDIKWRREEHELAELTSIQWRILEQAAILVKPNGRLIYSTCSIEPEENSLMVARFLERHQDFTLGSLPSWFPHSDQAGMVQIMPHHNHLDGFFIAVLEKNVEGK